MHRTATGDDLVAAYSSVSASFGDTCQPHSQNLAVLSLAIDRIRPRLAHEKRADGLPRIATQHFCSDQLSLIDLARQAKSRSQNAIGKAQVRIDLYAAPPPFHRLVVALLMDVGERHLVVPQRQLRIARAQLNSLQ